MSPRLPEWWDRALEITAHAYKRLEERELSEAQLRYMLEHVEALTEDREPGRGIAEASVEGRTWRIILEPDPEVSVIVVVTAYPA